ncbi:zinc finger BED domain-containing protein DAYSLEEPER-like [Chenopodium quinoa]|uniref:BED-type domain-containing protein n=1 Tax=Chenopodium quinoa TaxID=63459 RepID=A0A803LH64_CHEQI|nr:zinc finger BED domain-containing protein DAYSLEEPER-like [Chenopodium quinoa]XP_021760754.1 zinc finger BED domain-containing protein DAYSLEEPER-like [Chenopodium quinoa]
MTTTDENNEMVDSQQADALPGAENSVKVKPERAEPERVDKEVANSQPIGEQVDPQSAGKQAESEHVNNELAHPEPLGEDVLQTPPVSSEDGHPQLVNSEHVHSQPESVEEMHSQPVSMEHVQSQPSEFVQPQTVSAELVHPDPVNTEVVHPHPGSADLVYTQPLDSIDENNEMIDTEEADAQPREAEFANSQAEHPVTVKPERVAPEPMDMDMGEQVDQHATGEEHVSTELAHPEPLGEEVVYPPPVCSQDMHPQSVGAEHVLSHPVTMEMVHSQPGTADLVYSQPLSSDIVHSQPIASEFVHSQPVNAEHVHFQHGNLEPVHLQPLGVEHGNSHVHGGELVNSHAVGMELVNTQPLSTEVPNSQQETPDTQPNKRRKKKSIVWEHFTIETVGAGCRRAYCKVCKQSFAYSTGSKVAGTSHLKRHIAKGTCPVVLRQQEKNQLSPYMPKSGGTDVGTEHQPKRRYRTSSSPYLIFDQDRCRHEIAKMIIMHDYPLHMVEHPGFVSFVQNLQPRFDMVSFNIVQGDCVAIFLREKQNLQKFIEGIPGRICLTLDMWTSSQSTGFVFVTGQFIDNDWKLHRRLLNVVMEPFPESDRALSHAIGTCLSDWGLDRKLASITFNQPLGQAAFENLRALLAVKNSMLLDGQLLIKSCIARTLSSMAQEVISASEATIKKIRTSVKYVKTSESHEEKFLELKQQLQVPSEQTLSLDNITKWNTTYEMLLAASELKQVFSCLDTCDPDYKDAPSMDDWSQVENICMYLKLLYDTANLLLVKPTPSSNVFFHEVWKIQLELARAAASDDLFVAGLAKPLQDRFLKYWKNSCLVLAVAVAMDPRFKMKLVEFSFTKIFMDEAPVYIRNVDEGIHELFHEYVTHPLPLTPLEDGTDGIVKREDQGILNNNGLSDFDLYIMETTSQQMKSELDQYLEESLLPRIQDFDVLGWWKLNKIKYPTLSKMARDILTVPLSTVSAESVFDSSFKEMDSYRCSLRPETLEALICAKDWLQPDTIKAPKDLVKMEQL